MHSNSNARACPTVRKWAALGCRHEAIGGCRVTRWRRSVNERMWECGKSKFLKMNKNIIKISILLGFSALLFFGCKQKSKTNSKSPTSSATTISSENTEVSTFDTLAFINRVQSRPSDFGRYPLASQDSLKNDDLEHIPPRELRIIRNEIYARYGYRFKDQALQKYFEEQKWYKSLFDDVYQYLKPVERANIEFILEKEKTNPDISDEERFRVFLDLYFDKRVQIPYMLNAIFLGTQECCLSFAKQLPPTKKYEYLIHSSFGGCDNCSSFLSIYQYNKKGELLNTFELGDSDLGPYIDTTSNNRYELWFTYYPGPRYAYDDEITEEMWEEADAIPTDTIRFQFHYDKDDQIVITREND